MLYFFTTLAIGTPSSTRYVIRVFGSACSPQCLQLQRDFVRVSSGIHSAIHGKVRSGDVGGFRTREKRCHCGNLLNMPIAVERSGGLLRYRPITRSGIQLCVDRAWLDVVDRDAPAPDLSG